MPARWKISSTSFTAGASVLASGMSPRTPSTPCFIGFYSFSNGKTSARISSPRLCKCLITDLPQWPNSQTGPMVTEPPAGTKRMLLRSEQVVELNYDQEHGKQRDEL